MGISDATNDLSTNAFMTSGSERPFVVPGCAKKLGGSIYNRIGGAAPQTYFNTGCFESQTIASSPVFNPFAYGNESRTDNTLRTPGVANWDMSLFKNIPIREYAALDLRVESFNLFNRVQFGSPNSQVGNSEFGWITSQYNNPRILQVSGRITF